MRLSNNATLQQGRYIILDVLGQGGYGITYLAWDNFTKTKVAIKEFFPSGLCLRDADSHKVLLHTGPNAELVQELKKKFFKEAKHLSKLDHENIVRVFNSFEENDTAYFVMDYIEGDTLESYVQKHGALPVNNALRYISGIASALDYIHSRRINHLDVKPCNILLRASDDTPMLVDFGLAKHYDRRGRQTSYTPSGISTGFAPIEQYKDDGVSRFSPAIDVYSLGATFFYMLTATNPSSSIELLNSGITFPQNFPKQFQPIVRKAMMPMQKDRYQSVREFITDLYNPQNASAGKETEIIKPDKQWNNRTVYISIISAVLLAAIGFVSYNYYKSQGVRNAADVTEENVDDSIALLKSRQDSVLAVERAREEAQKQARLDSLAEINVFNDALPLSFVGEGYDENGNEGLVELALERGGRCRLQLHFDGDADYKGTFTKNGTELTFNFDRWDVWDENIENIVSEPLPEYERAMRRRKGYISAGLLTMWIDLPEYGRCQLRRK